MEVVQNFINGKPVDARGRRHDAARRPVHGCRPTGRRPARRPPMSTMPSAAASAAFEGWGVATPSERSLALLRIADALET